MTTVMFNPYTGTPRHPSDIASDPSGLLILEPVAPLRAAAQVVALEPEGPDGHGVNWLAGNRPRPGDLLYGGDAVARALAAKNEAESRELKAAQELDEAITMLHNFADLCAEFCDHTPDSFNRQVMRIGNAARLLLNARKSGSSDLETSGIEDGAGFVYCWLVEEFGPNGNSTGRYMLDQGALTITADVYAARKLRRQQSAGFRAIDMTGLHGGDWRAVEHGFDDSKTPNVQGEAPSTARTTTGETR